jgi:hypothetical protein
MESIFKYPKTNIFLLIILIIISSTAFSDEKINHSNENKNESEFQFENSFNFQSPEMNEVGHIKLQNPVASDKNNESGRGIANDGSEEFHPQPKTQNFEE